ncbi:MAG: aromatic ring-hydroxylating dioxygenase subunit alpha [Kiloniellales bacterium]|nr:aromatic ring-hydroxylating dioxygenase subunit alpha [Kiloniellales bacterium]
MSSKSVSGKRGPFTDEATTSFTLPSRYYTDEEIHRRELRNIFQKSWCYVGHITDLEEPGSYFVDNIAGQPVLVIRGQDERIRAFFNVCQHRGHELLCGRGKVRAAITCPYHGWTYGLDGLLLAARLTDDVPDFRRSDFPLIELPLSISAGLIFVNPDVDANSFEAEAENFGETILQHLPDMAQFVAHYRFTFEIEANWKIVVDNFSEGYHIPVAHPELSTLYNARGEPALIGKRFAFYRNTARTGYKGFETRPGEPYLSWTLWPNLCMLSLPGSQNLIVLRMAPNGCTKCRERVDIYSAPGPTDPNFETVKSLFADTFNREDIAIVESVQRGISSLGYDQSRYVADKAESWFSESALHRFHAQVLNATDPRGKLD